MHTLMAVILAALAAKLLVEGVDTLPKYCRKKGGKALGKYTLCSAVQAHMHNLLLTILQLTAQHDQECYYCLYARRCQHVIVLCRKNHTHMHWQYLAILSAFTSASAADHLMPSPC